jgi:hypothetical protein
MSDLWDYDSYVKSLKKSKGSYVIAIPSYNRPDGLRDKTLTMLRENNIPKNKIYVFLHNQEQADLYKKVIPSDLYGHIVVTNLNKGIVGQRNFITDYFKENQHILSLDDDVENILKLKGDKLVKSYELENIIHKGFELCKQHNYTLWGLYPVANAFYMKNPKEYTTDLRFIIGAFYGFINKKRYSDLPIKHDYDLSIQAYLNDSGLIRFNHITFKTKYYNNKGGIGSNYIERLDKLKKDTDSLIKKYPELVYENKRREGEILLRKGKKISGGKITKPIQNVTDKENPEIIVDNISQNSHIKKLQDKILEQLDQIKIIKTTRTRAKTIGKGYSMNFGAGLKTLRPKGEYVANKKYPELFKSIIEYGNAILPTGFKYEIITINKNLKAKKHTDKFNTGLGFITMLGNYTGGGLYIYQNGKPVLYDTHNALIGFNGALYPHRTQPFKGTRYALIFYKQVGETVKGTHMEGSGFTDDALTDKIY